MTTVSIKFLSRSEPPDRIVLLTTLLWVPLSLPGAFTVWRWPDAATWPWLVLSGFLGTGGHYFWTRALRLADASVLAPFSYVQLLIVTRARMAPVRREARRVHGDRRRDHRRRDALHRTTRGEARAQARIEIIATPTEPQV